MYHNLAGSVAAAMHWLAQAEMHFPEAARLGPHQPDPAAESGRRAFARHQRPGLGAGADSPEALVRERSHIQTADGLEREDYLPMNVGSPESSDNSPSQ